MNAADPNTHTSPTHTRIQDQPGIAFVEASCFVSAILFPSSEKLARRTRPQCGRKSEYQRGPQNLLRRQSVGAPESPENDQTEAQRHSIADKSKMQKENTLAGIGRKRQFLLRDGSAEKSVHHDQGEGHQ